MHSQMSKSLRPHRVPVTTTLTLEPGREVGTSQPVCPELAMRICKSEAVRHNMFIKKTVLQNSDVSKDGPICHIELTLAKTWKFSDKDSDSSLQFPVQDLAAAAQVFLIANRAGENATERIDLCLRGEDGYTQLGCLGLFDLSYRQPATMKEGCIETLTLGTVVSYALDYLLMVDTSTHLKAKRKHYELSGDIP